MIKGELLALQKALNCYKRGKFEGKVIIYIRVQAREQSKPGSLLKKKGRKTMLFLFLNKMLSVSGTMVTSTLAVNIAPINYFKQH